MLHDETRGNDYIQTYKGSFWPLDPREEDIDITTIAHALSNLCRFGGHTKVFYSVAQHCLECTAWAPTELKLQALMHDASEAYIVDVPRPIKNLLPDYSVMENKIQQAICRKYNLPEEMDSAIKLIDNAMLVTEASQLLYETNGWWRQSHWPTPYNYKIQVMSPQVAEEQFLTTFNYLSKK